MNEQHNAHLVAYLRHHQRLKLQAAARHAARTAASSYQAAMHAQPQRVAAIAAGHQQPIEPVRYGRDVEQRDWTDPYQTNRFATSPQQVRGFRRMDELVRLHKRGTVGIEHLAAGIRLRNDCEMADGARPGQDFTGVRTSGDGAGPTMRELQALARYREAMVALEGHADLTAAVVIGNHTVAAWAAKAEVTIHVGLRRFQAAMEALRKHYGEKITHDCILQAGTA